MFAAIKLFFSGSTIGYWLIAIGVLLAVSNGFTYWETASYYNKLIVTTSTTAAQAAYTAGVKAQQSADAAMVAAAHKAGADEQAREDAEHPHNVVVTQYIHDHVPTNLPAQCNIPKDVAAQINGLVK